MATATQKAVHQPSVPILPPPDIPLLTPQFSLQPKNLKSESELPNKAKSQIFQNSKIFSTNRQCCHLQKMQSFNVLHFSFFSGQEIIKFPHKNFVTCVQFHPTDPALFLSGTFKSAILCWDTRTGNVSVQNAYCSQSATNLMKQNLRAQNEIAGTTDY